MFQDLSKYSNLSSHVQNSNLDINTDLKLIKKRYKELVKENHPDVKGDSKKVIDKFREIVEAYNYLIERYKK